MRLDNDCHATALQLVDRVREYLYSCVSALFALAPHSQFKVGGGPSLLDALRTYCSAVAGVRSRSRYPAPAFMHCTLLLLVVREIEQAKEIVNGGAIRRYVRITWRGNGVGEVVTTAGRDRTQTPVSLDEFTIETWSE